MTETKVRFVPFRFVRLRYVPLSYVKFRLLRDNDDRNKSEFSSVKLRYIELCCVLFG